MNAWGLSWGTNWASSWGADAPTPPVVLIDTHDDAPKRNRTYRERQERLRRDISEAIDPVTAAPVVKAAAVQILPRRTEYVEINEPEDADELAIVMALA